MRATLAAGRLPLEKRTAVRPSDCQRRGSSYRNIRRLSDTAESDSATSASRHAKGGPVSDSPNSGPTSGELLPHADEDLCGDRATAVPMPHKGRTVVRTADFRTVGLAARPKGFDPEARV